MHTSDYLSIEGDGPAYSTTDIVDIHRLMRVGEHDRSPYDLPRLDRVEDEFYCVAAVKKYGSVVPGGDAVLLSTDIVKVELGEIRTPKVVQSRKFSEMPRILLRRYVPEDILSRIETMDPEFIVTKGETEQVNPGEFVLSENYVGARLGEVLHSVPLPDNWPLSALTDDSGLALVLVDYASTANSYSVHDLVITERPTNGVSRPRTP
jgi:hypothetical protein